MAATAAALSVGASALASSCTGDLNFDGQVNGADLGVLLSDWGGNQDDLNGDGVVDGADLGTLLSNWGACPQAVEWNLVTQLTGTTTVAIDQTGATVRTWTGAGQGSSVGYLRADGSLVRPCVYSAGALSSAGRGGRIQVFGPSGALQNDLIVASSTTQQHHDIRPMPNGNILCIVWDVRSIDEQSAAGRVNATAAVWSEQILELRPTGASTYDVVWQWKLWDHLVQDAAPGSANYGSVAGHPELVDANNNPAASPVDWIHMNSIDYDPVRDEIVVSSRSWSELWVIDHSTTTAQAATHAGGARPGLLRLPLRDVDSRGDARCRRHHGLQQRRPHRQHQRLVAGGADHAAARSVGQLRRAGDRRVRPGRAHLERGLGRRVLRRTNAVRRVPHARQHDAHHADLHRHRVRGRFRRQHALDPHHRGEHRPRAAVPPGERVVDRSLSRPR